MGLAAEDHTGKPKDLCRTGGMKNPTHTCNCKRVLEETRAQESNPSVKFALLNKNHMLATLTFPIPTHGKGGKHVLFVGTGHWPGINPYPSSYKLEPPKYTSSHLNPLLFLLFFFIQSCVTWTWKEPTWPELVGSNNWEGLLDPLNLTLRRLILRCGDLCQATYDAFNNDKHSKYTGCSRYGKKDFFKKVGFPPDEDYIVSSFLYATASVDLPVGFFVQSLSREAWSRESNWIGYIAVSSDKATRASGRREIYVAWRGTTRVLEWIDVFDPEPVSIEPLLAKKDVGSSSDEPPKVMKGWYTIYTSDDPKSPFTKLSARQQFLSKIKELVSLYKDEKEQLSLVCAGHSLGACLAILSAFDVVENGLSKIGDRPEFPVTAFVFGSPEVGNEAFNERLKKLPNLRVLLVKNEIDLIPDYPGQLLGYTDTGVKLVVDSRKSPYLKDSKNPGDWHNLQGLLHVVAGWNGKEGEFEFKVKRSIGLVNKSCDFLKDECLIPGSWWVEKNRGMVLEKDGEWQLASPSEEDMPVPEY